ncbi:hypothetical protein L227DRAFT_606604 [Lentinus tigrinus ALCF2SS1-6]|uniref:Uncharacterized protein n=1 Tax=Lentinus tigrinus ALCF2SS1-6 TaxID=1328759 RepID=A0A5C2ST18_9APHY|nr:hypothetical protein L227DRAFT_606604 [Lentinus tigrinus ALCF2SS1-6]
MSFLGLRKWPTPVAKPLWPFVSASLLTWFLVGKMQDLGVKCAYSLSFSPHPLPPRVSEGFRNDPRNPYAAQIAKQSHH